MARELFGDVSDPSVKLGSQARYTVPLSVAAHVVVFGALVIAPLMAADVLPSPPILLEFIPAKAEAPPPPPPPPAAARSAQAQAAPVAASTAAPASAPDSIQPESSAPEPPGVPGGVHTGIGSDLLGPGVGWLPAAPIAPVVAPPPSRPLPVGGNIKVPAKLRHVPPVYPMMAQQARVEGVVILEATIGADGRVKDVRVLRSQPLLDQAAIDAVMQWRFTPTLLNGAPVPVLMTVTVNFTLSR